MSKDDPHAGVGQDQRNGDPPPSPVVALPDQDPPLDPAAKTDQEQQGGSHPFRNLPGQTKKLLGMVKWGLVLEFLIVLAAFLGLYMQHQATQESLRLAKDSLDATEKSLGLAGLALAETQRSNWISMRSLESSAVAAKAGLDATRESNRLTKRGVEISESTAEATQRVLRIKDRSRLVVKDTSMILNAGEELAIAVEVENRGQIPAIVGSFEVQFPGMRPRYTEWPSVDFPPDTSRTFYSKFPFPLTEDSISKIKERGLKVVFWGSLTYSDDLGGPHTLPMCVETWNVGDPGIVSGDEFKKCTKAVREKYGIPPE